MPPIEYPLGFLLTDYSYKVDPLIFRCSCLLKCLCKESVLSNVVRAVLKEYKQAIVSVAVLSSDGPEVVRM